ncbi:MAG TPA: PAS domain-containing protein [Trichocoleus sp.]
MNPVDSSGKVDTSATQEARILLIATPKELASVLQRQPYYQVYQESLEDNNSGPGGVGAEPGFIPDLVVVSSQRLRQAGSEPLLHRACQQQTPVILLIDRQQQTDGDWQPDLKVTDYLVWPCSPFELLARVRTGLELARLQQQTRQAAAVKAAAEMAPTREAGTGVPLLITDVLESITDGFFSLDNQWRFTYLNRASEVLSGESRHKLLGQVFWQVYPGLLGTDFEQQMRRAMVERVPLHFEAPSVQVGLWREVHVYPRSDGLAVYWRDITERRQSDEALRLSEDRYRTLANALPQIIWINDPVGNVEFFNQRWEEYTGFPSTVGVNLWQEIIYPDDAELALNTRNRAIQAQEAYEIECRLRRFDQAYRWHLVRVVPFKDAQGQILQWFGSATDIHDVKQSEAALRDSEAIAKARADELEVFMATVPAAVWIAHDPYCHHMTANQAAHKLVEQPPGATVTATPENGDYPFPFKIQRHGQDIPLDQLPMQKAGLTGEEAEEEFDFVFDNGEVRAIWGRAVPLRGEEGQIRGVIGVFLNISERKRIEQEREQLLERERSARAEAETANRLKDEFLAVLSHELRSPLNPILGWARLLQSRSVGPETLTRALQSIERNVRLQVQLVEDLLDVSRILRGKLVLEKTPVDLSAAVQAAIETVLPMAVAKEIQIIPDFAAAVGPVQGDTMRLQQVIWNLLSNAVKFTPQGGRVEVRLERAGQAALAALEGDREASEGALEPVEVGESSRAHRAYAQIIVSDTGKGIDAEFLPHVFDYFRQQDSTTTRQFGGLGIGLAIVRHLTEMHGGSVSVASPGEGLGATFTVTLPSGAPLPSAAGPVLTEAAATPDSLKGRRILVVDDDPDTRQFIAFLLGQLGVAVTAAESAQAGLDQLEQAQFDLLISDIGMPGMDGYQFIRAVRQQFFERGEQKGVLIDAHSMKAIAMTAYAGEQDGQRARVAGFDAHLAKPVAPDQLLKTLVQLLERPPAAPLSGEEYP